MNNLLQINQNCPAPLAVELAALCVSGSVAGNKVRGEFFNYEMAPGKDQCLVITERPQLKQGEAAFGELCSVIIGFFAQGMEVRPSGAIFQDHSIETLLNWLSTETPRKLDLAVPYHKDSHLSLGDLIEINHWLSQKEQAIADLERMPQFTATFPFVDIYAGDYSNLRHRSGHEIFMVWQDNKFAEQHKIDAPAPADELQRKYACFQAGKVYRHKPGLRLDRLGPYRKSRENRQKYAYLLGGLPESEKRRIFRWLADTANDIDYYHDSRGGQVIPEIFEIAFEDKVLTATRDLILRLRKAL
ncbi:MAG: hypothetical protein J0M35_00580 [Candidatus Obscuribacter phosphatis]|uniref:Uncharacterized protein n=1 Tax=Candidatus Obscuribacter phosphatis TaxID=1906157 RepID=A0A8J7TLB0_9BACT|nr:hypothetical protein [Candidatus Obscuribacter phosphatis]